MSAETVGARLREARTQHKLSLRSVAQALGVSASLISQVETGKTQPSVSTLYALATHLGLSLDDLLGVVPPANGRAAQAQPVRSTHSKIQRAADNPVLEMENGVRWERLASGVDQTADALLVTYEPGASSSIEGKLMRHYGVESAYILEGELTLQLEFDVHVLGPGDSLQFDSVLPHLYSNKGSTIAKGVWFVIGRRRPEELAPIAGLETLPSTNLGSAVDVMRAMDDIRH
ncbi:MAG TPA: helix-turn-helix domain-containing protein [Homoserinimonas sp.]|nr:helix-turn-helix domain-containing protein [Homoserinimonas sp.]